MFRSKNGKYDLLVVGLGNPGAKYKGTKHNVGFDAIDAMCKDKFKGKHNSKVTEIALCGKRVLLAKPQTFMNLSGEAVHEMCKAYGLGLNEIVIIYDDYALEPGKIRIRKKGSHGGHNGMRSIIDYMDSDEFCRIRIGIGKPEQGQAIDYVLSAFTQEQAAAVKEAVARVPDIVAEIISSGVDTAMNKYNTK